MLKALSLLMIIRNTVQLKTGYKARRMTFSLQLLSARSRLPAGSTPVSFSPEYPEATHTSSRVAFTSGFDDDDFFTGIGWRGAYHSLNDPAYGLSVFGN